MIVKFQTANPYGENALWELREYGFPLKNIWIQKYKKYYPYFNHEGEDFHGCDFYAEVEVKGNDVLMEYLARIAKKTECDLILDFDNFNNDRLKVTIYNSWIE